MPENTEIAEQLLYLATKNFDFAAAEAAIKTSERVVIASLNQSIEALNKDINASSFWGRLFSGSARSEYAQKQRELNVAEESLSRIQKDGLTEKADLNKLNQTESSGLTFNTMINQLTANKSEIHSPLYGAFISVDSNLSGEVDFSKYALNRKGLNKLKEIHEKCKAAGLETLEDLDTILYDANIIIQSKHGSYEHPKRSTEVAARAFIMQTERDTENLSKLGLTKDELNGLARVLDGAKDRDGVGDRDGAMALLQNYINDLMLKRERNRKAL